MEVLLERVLGDNMVVAQVRASKSPKPGTTLEFWAGKNENGRNEQTLKVRVEGRQGDFLFYSFFQN